jgi:hypothetical protein
MMAWLAAGVALPVLFALASLSGSARRSFRLPSRTIPVVLPAQPGRSPDPRLAGSYRFEKNGWICVHLQGAPEAIGFQHGYLLAPEIADALGAVRLEETHTTVRN